MQLAIPHFFGSAVFLFGKNCVSAENVLLGEPRIERRGAFAAECVRQATPETLSAIMGGFDSGLIDGALFRDLMDARIRIERECTRLACARLTPQAQQMLQAHTEAIYAADDEQAAERSTCIINA